jgi:hypothetical protein
MRQVEDIDVMAYLQRQRIIGPQASKGNVCTAVNPGWLANRWDYGAPP